MRFANPFAPRDAAERAEAAARIKNWTRSALCLDDAARVLVHELACSRPNCPPRETVILIVPATDAAPFKIALHRAMRDLTENDLRRAWAGREAAP
ncbi:MAG: hypothetical protein P0Y66_17435 [Candidatus Kaistia colombiensis]|nr:MAG: hypothetical protein P0Y66_17435 [Kaistia sp.]